MQRRKRDRLLAVDPITLEKYHVEARVEKEAGRESVKLIEKIVKEKVLLNRKDKNARVFKRRLIRYARVRGIADHLNPVL
jgi:hypothetical protein